MYIHGALNRIVDMPSCQVVISLSNSNTFTHNCTRTYILTKLYDIQLVIAGLLCDHQQ